MLVILLLYLFLILQSIAFYTLLERHLLGLSQNRFGPKKTSWFGLLQPIIDGVKLIKKEQILLFNCTPSIFLGVILLNFGVFYVEISALPYQFRFIFINWGYLMVIILLGVNSICLLIGSIFSKSKYSFLGGIRGVVATVSYEIQFNLNMLIFILYHKSFILKNISNVGLILFFMTFFISILVELGRTPFDYSESESDLVSGVNTEYSSVGFVLIFLKEYGSLLFFSLITSILFFGGYFLGAVFIFCLIITIRSSFPRYRIDNLISLIWLMLFFHVVIGLFCTYHVFIFWIPSLSWEHQTVNLSVSGSRCIL